MENEITLNTKEVMDYVKTEVKQYDILEISYSRVFVPGEVMNIETNEEEGSLNLLLQLKGELLNDTVQLDLEDIKDDLLEIRHIKNENELVVIVVEEA
jgi:hypothetical protein